MVNASVCVRMEAVMEHVVVHILDRLVQTSSNLYLQPSNSCAYSKIYCLESSKLLSTILLDNKYIMYVSLIPWDYHSKLLHQSMSRPASWSRCSLKINETYFMSKSCEIFRNIFFLPPSPVDVHCSHSGWWTQTVVARHCWAGHVWLLWQSPGPLLNAQSSCKKNDSFQKLSPKMTNMEGILPQRTDLHGLTGQCFTIKTLGTGCVLVNV